MQRLVAIAGCLLASGCHTVFYDRYEIYDRDGLVGRSIVTGDDEWSPVYAVTADNELCRFRRGAAWRSFSPDSPLVPPVWRAWLAGRIIRVRVGACLTVATADPDRLYALNPADGRIITETGSGPTSR